MINQGSLETTGPTHTDTVQVARRGLRLATMAHHSKSTILIREGSKEAKIRTTMVILIVHTRKTRMTSLHLMVVEAEEAAASSTRRTEAALEDKAEEAEEAFQARVSNRSWPCLRIQRMLNSKSCRFTPTNLNSKLVINVLYFFSTQLRFMRRMRVQQPKIMCTSTQLTKLLESSITPRRRSKCLSASTFTPAITSGPLNSWWRKSILSSQSWMDARCTFWLSVKASSLSILQTSTRPTGRIAKQWARCSTSSSRRPCVKQVSSKWARGLSSTATRTQWTSRTSTFKFGVVSRHVLTNTLTCAHLSSIIATSLCPRTQLSISSTNFSMRSKTSCQGTCLKLEKIKFSSKNAGKRSSISPSLPIMERGRTILSLTLSLSQVLLLTFSSLKMAKQLALLVTSTRLTTLRSLRRSSLC